MAAVKRIPRSLLAALSLVPCALPAQVDEPPADRPAADAPAAGEAAAPAAGENAAPAAGETAAPAVPVAPPAVAADSPAKEAVDAFNKGRAIEAVRLARPLAEAGNGDALLVLGVAHQFGQGAEIDPEKAADCYRRARAAGNQEAAYRLARVLIEQGKDETRKEARELLEELAKTDAGAASRILGEGALRGWFGGEADFEKTRFWWAKSAAAGDVEAMLALGQLYDGNFGFPEKRDPKAALGQFLKAAGLGNAAAMVAAGSRLLNGAEEIRDEKAGREWLDKGLKEGQFDACLALGDFEEAIKKDDAKAFEHYRTGAEGGQTGCMLKLAQFITEGRAGREKSEEEALKWLEKAGEGNNPLGHFQAAVILLKREGAGDVLKGYAHLVAAADAGLADVQNEVGLLFLSGKLGGVRDAPAASGWFSRAARAGFAPAANNLGALYEQGLGVPQNFDNAGRLYTQACNAGHPQATTALGRLYARGAGTKQDLPRAWALFSLAVERGDNDGKAPLGDLTSQLTEEQMAAGRKLLEEYKQPAAKGGAKEDAKEGGENQGDKPDGENKP